MGASQARLGCVSKVVCIDDEQDDFIPPNLKIQTSGNSTERAHHRIRVPLCPSPPSSHFTHWWILSAARQERTPNRHQLRFKDFFLFNTLPVAEAATVPLPFLFNPRRRPFSATVFSLCNHREDLQCKIAVTKAALFTRTWLLRAHLPWGYLESQHLQHAQPAATKHSCLRGILQTTWDSLGRSQECFPTVLPHREPDKPPASNMAMARGRLLQDADF